MSPIITRSRGTRPEDYIAVWLLAWLDSEEYEPEDAELDAENLVDYLESRGYLIVSHSPSSL